MTEKITVKDFIEKYNGDTDSLEIRVYIPITEKRAIIEKLVTGIITEDGILTTYDSIEKNIIFSLASINIYTNLGATTPEDYDALRETGLLFEIYEKMDVNGDYKNFRDMFEMRFKDYMREANTLMGTVNKLLKNFEDVFKNLDAKQIGELLKLLDTVTKE